MSTAGSRSPSNAKSGRAVAPAPEPPPVAFTAADCTTSLDGGPVIDGCMTAEVHCGDVIKGDTRGGVDQLDTRFYERGYCTPATTRHDDGEERIYKLVVANPQTRVLATLDTPCASLDLAALYGVDGATCPDGAGSAARCEMDVTPNARKRVDIRANDPQVYWLVIEGQYDDDAGGFALSIQCETW